MKRGASSVSRWRRLQSVCGQGAAEACLKSCLETPGRTGVLCTMNIVAIGPCLYTALRATELHFHPLQNHKSLLASADDIVSGAAAGPDLTEGLSIRTDSCRFGNTQFVFRQHDNPLRAASQGRKAPEASRGQEGALHVETLLVDAVRTVLHGESVQAVDLRHRHKCFVRCGVCVEAAVGQITFLGSVSGHPLQRRKAVLALWAAIGSGNGHSPDSRMGLAEGGITWVMSFARMGIASSRFWKVDPCT